MRKSCEIFKNNSFSLGLITLVIISIYNRIIKFWPCANVNFKISLIKFFVKETIVQLESALIIF